MYYVYEYHTLDKTSKWSTSVSVISFILSSLTCEKRELNFLMDNIGGNEYFKVYFPINLFLWSDSYELFLPFLAGF